MGHVLRACSRCRRRIPIGATCECAPKHGWDRKTTPRVYDDPEYRRARPIVLERAAGRCEVIEDGRRCTDPAGSVDHVRAVALCLLLGEPVRHDPGALRAVCRRHKALKDAADQREVRAVRARQARARRAARSSRT